MEAEEKVTQEQGEKVKDEEETITPLSGRQRNRTRRRVYIHEIRKEEVLVENVKKNGKRNKK